MKRLCQIILLFFFLGGKAVAISPLEWEAYPALGEITFALQTNQKLYALATSSLFSVSLSDYTVTLYDKINYLSDTEISLINYCDAARKLVIVYSNQNIDLLDNNDYVENIPDYGDASLSSDKSVYSIDIYDDHAYLSTGFGIVNINVSKAEITNTYNFGLSVLWSHIENDSIFAETRNNGQYGAALSDNLLDPASWRSTGRATTQKVVTVDPDLLAMANAYKPNAPQIGYFAFMRLYDKALFTVPGYGGAYERDAAVQILEDEDWTVIAGDTGYEAEPRYRGLFAIDRDPTQQNRWLVAAIPGLYEYVNGKITNCYYWKNSILERAQTVEDDNLDYTEVTTLRFDSEGNAWLLQGIAATPGIICLTHDGQFRRYEHSELMLSYGYTWVYPKDLDFASSGLLWFVNNDWRTPAFASYDTRTDNLTIYSSFINEDNTDMEVTRVRCWAEDKEGNIWIGTDMGPAYLSKEDLNYGGTTVQQPKIPRQDDPTLADYLLSGVDINCLAIDAGNRKWFGSASDGVYVVSSDNMVQEEHFTAENSGLLSNTVESITIDDSSGLVYIGTEKGLCAYASAITETKETLQKDDIYAYPNPVHPDYEGLVTVVGLTYGAQIRITTTSGHLVKRGTSTGGSYSWDCTDEQGRKVASGVYLVLISTEDGKEGLATKIAVVR